MAIQDGANGTNVAVTKTADIVNGKTDLVSEYKYTNQYVGKPKPVKVIVIGAGISGIAAVKIFKDTFAGKPVDLVIYEKNADVGGTWLENRYPG
jgi:hypothetical protein